MQATSNTELVAYLLIGGGIIIGLGSLIATHLRQRKASFLVGTMLDTFSRNINSPNPRQSTTLMTANMRGSQEIVPPGIFDETQIKADLESLRGAKGALEQYFLRLRESFTKQNQIAIIQEWQNLYTAAAGYLEAQAKVQQVIHKQGRLGLENTKEVVSLEADIEEQRLRQDKAASARRELNHPSPKKSDYQKQMEQAQEQDDVDLSYRVRKQAGKKLRTRQQLDKWLHDETQDINHNPRLTPEQRTAQQMLLWNDYQREIRMLDQADDESEQEPNIYQSH